MRIRSCLISLTAVLAVSFATDASAMQATRTIKVISSEGARAMVDACTEWATQKKVVLAMAVLDWGGNLIESHAMEGSAANAIDTALLKAKSALRWRRATSETNKIVRNGENLAPAFMGDFPQQGALPIVVDGQFLGAIGVGGMAPTPGTWSDEICAHNALTAVLGPQPALLPDLPNPYSISNNAATQAQQRAAAQ